DVHHRLARLGVAVSSLRVRQRPQLVDRVEVHAGQSVRLALVEVPAHPDVTVRECEHRLRVREHVEVELPLAHAPRLEVERVVDHDVATSSSARSVTTIPAPCSRSASPSDLRSTPTTSPKPPARPASTPARASSNTAHARGSVSTAAAPARNMSGA